MEKDKDFDSYDNVSDVIVRFEEMLRNQENYFFDVEVYEMIIDYYKQKDQIEQALQACNCAISQYPYTSELLIEKANLLSFLKEYTEAEEIIEKLQNIYPNDPDIILIKANLFHLKGNHEVALSLLKQLLDYSVQEDKEELNYKIAYLHQILGEHEQAVLFYKKVISSDPSYEEAVHELNLCLEAINDLDSGRAFYQKMIDRDPFSHYAWYNIGLLYDKMNKFADAVTAFDYATLIKEDFAPAYIEMGMAYMNLESYENAAKAYENALLYTDPYADLLCCLGAALEKSNKLNAAFKQYKRATELDYTWDEAWYGLGSCLMSQERWYEATHYLKKAVEFNELNDTYWLSIANTEYQLGNNIASSEAFEKASQLYSNNSELWLNWSYLYFEEGEELKAVELIKEGIEECPQDALLYYRAAAYLISMRKYKEAFNFLENALILDFDKHQSLYEFFPELETQKALHKIIEQFRK